MANPENPLDVFVTYVPHYELHLSNNWEDLDAIRHVDINGVTEPKRANGTLLINTRKDAHQHIDNIKFTYYGPMVDPSGSMACVGTASFEVIEPNGVSFIEKLTERMKELNITNYSAGAQFGLKIFFVGRTASGAELTIPFNGIIPLHLINLEAKYSQKGGEYNLSMVISSDAIGSSPLRPDNGIARAVGFVNKNISFKASSVQEAIKLLETKLNQNYSDVYATELRNTNGAKEIKYHIELDPKITGGLNLVTKDSYAPGEKCQLTFVPSIDIGTMIRQILMASKDVCDMIGQSNDGIGKEGHPGVKLPILQTFYHVDKSVVNVIYKVVLYEGGDQSDLFIFDYYFSGKNVDVLEFEVKFNQMTLWMQSGKNGLEQNRNADSQNATLDPEAFAKDNLPENKTCTRLNSNRPQQKDTPTKSGDPALIPITNRSEGTGFAKHSLEAVPSARLAFETLGKAVGATHNQVTFSIRGHLMLLDRVVYTPDGKGPPPSGVAKSTWIKVNIFDQEFNQFFYTGKYQLLTIENSFSGAKFTQNLTVTMVDPE
jgi:hypothetical protein